MAQQVIRSDVNDTLKMSLLCEVQGFCPLCRRSLVVKRGPKVVRVFDVAHIYPLNPSVADKKLLENEELLSLNIDSEDNFIALCKECHKIYDTKKTVDEYRNLVSIKKAINKMKILSQTWDKQTLHKDIAKVSEHISKLNNDDILKTELSFEALMLSEKNDNSLGVINEVKISQYIKYFFIPIKEALKQLEREEEAKSYFICSQVKSYFLLLAIQKYSQSEIFEHMSEWFMINTGINDRAKAEVLVSYFVQNCEIFSKC